MSAQPVPTPGDTPITLNGVSKWQGFVFAVLGGVAVAAASYTAARADIVRSNEKSDLAIAKVVEIEKAIERVDRLEERQQETTAKMDKVLAGIEAIDDKLFTLVCQKDPTKCLDYKRSVPR